VTLSRRALLAAAGATVALPWLPSLAPSRAADPAPRRLVVLFSPNGFRMDLWRPTSGDGPLRLGATMASLADLVDRLVVVSGLANTAADPIGTGSHARGTGSFLSCVPIAADRVANGVTVDQVAAGTLGRDTALRSLELGVDPIGGVGFCEAPYSCTYTRHVAWSEAATPLPPISSPRLAFRRLFAGGDPGATAALHARLGASVLDVVRDQAADVAGRLSGDDRQRLDAYLTGVRELEDRLQRLATAPSCTIGAAPTVDVPPLEVHADLLLDLAVLALACDRTRVVTCMLGVGASNVVHDFLPGVNGGHHDLSHHGDDADKLAQLAAIDAWHVERFGRLVRALRDTPEGGGSLLDGTVVLLGSELGDGDLHDHHDLPFLLAGDAGGAVRTGRHLVRDGAPAADLYLALLHALGVPASTFGSDGTGPLDGLLA
jgi:hypothetical protein